MLVQLHEASQTTNLIQVGIRSMSAMKKQLQMQKKPILHMKWLLMIRGWILLLTK